MQTDIHIPRFRFGKKTADIFPYWIGLLALGILFGLYGAFVVLRDGLDVTGLTNKVPWGLWVVMDLASISLGGSAFVFGVIVYLMKLKRFEIVAKLAVLLGFLGYTAAGMVIWFDLGQPLRFWHPMVCWQPHSLLWEITMCVILYLGVLSAEILPVVVEHSFFYEHPLHKRYPIIKKLVELAKKLAHWLHKLVPILAVVGLTLSLLHQASLGAYYSQRTRRVVQPKRSRSIRIFRHERRDRIPVFYGRHHVSCDAPRLSQGRNTLRCCAPLRWHHFAAYLPAFMGLGSNLLLFVRCQHHVANRSIECRRPIFVDVLDRANPASDHCRRGNVLGEINQKLPIPDGFFSLSYGGNCPYPLELQFCGADRYAHV